MMEVYKQVFMDLEFAAWKSPPSNCSLSQLPLCLTDSLEYSNTRHCRPTSWGSFCPVNLEQNVDLCLLHKKVIPLSLEQKQVKCLPCVRSSRCCSWYKAQEKQIQNLSTALISFLGKFSIILIACLRGLAFLPDHLLHSL